MGFVPVGQEWNIPLPLRTRRILHDSNSNRIASRKSQKILKTWASHEFSRSTQNFFWKFFRRENDATRNFFSVKYYLFFKYFFKLIKLFPIIIVCCYSIDYSIFAKCPVRLARFSIFLRFYLNLYVKIWKRVSEKKVASIEDSREGNFEVHFLTGKCCFYSVFTLKLKNLNSPWFSLAVSL